MDPLKPFRELIDRRLWPVALLLVAALLATGWGDVARGDRLEGQKRNVAVALVLLDAFEGRLEHVALAFQHLGEAARVEHERAGHARRAADVTRRLGRHGARGFAGVTVVDRAAARAGLVLDMDGLP